MPDLSLTDHEAEVLDRALYAYACTLVNCSMSDEDSEAFGQVQSKVRMAVAVGKIIDPDAAKLREIAGTLDRFLNKDAQALRQIAERIEAATGYLPEPEEEVLKPGDPGWEDRNDAPWES